MYTRSDPQVLKKYRVGLFEVHTQLLKSPKGGADQYGNHTRIDCARVEHSIDVESLDTPDHACVSVWSNKCYVQQAFSVIGIITNFILVALLVDIMLSAGPSPTEGLASSADDADDDPLAPRPSPLSASTRPKRWAACAAGLCTLCYLVVFAVAASLRESPESDGALCGPRNDFHYGHSFWLLVAAFAASLNATIGFGFVACL